MGEQRYQCGQLAAADGVYEATRGGVRFRWNVAVTAAGSRGRSARREARSRQPSSVSGILIRSGFREGEFGDVLGGVVASQMCGMHAVQGLVERLGDAEGGAVDEGDRCCQQLRGRDRAWSRVEGRGRGRDRAWSRVGSRGQGRVGVRGRVGCPVGGPAAVRLLSAGCVAVRGIGTSSRDGGAAGAAGAARSAPSVTSACEGCSAGRGAGDPAHQRFGPADHGEAASGETELGRKGRAASGQPPPLGGLRAACGGRAGPARVRIRASPLVAGVADQQAGEPGGPPAAAPVPDAVDEIGRAAPEIRGALGAGAGTCTRIHNSVNDRYA